METLQPYVSDIFDNPKNYAFTGLSRFFGADRKIGHWILNFARRSTLPWNKTILDVFNILSVIVIAWPSELATLNFQDRLAWIFRIDEMLLFFFFDQQNLNPASIFVIRYRRPPIIRKIKFFPDYRRFPVLADEKWNQIWIVQVKIHKKISYSHFW